jgi:hypothetical protein
MRDDRQFNGDSSVPAIIFPSLAVLRVGLWPLIPHSVRRLLRWVRRRERSPRWINEQLARRIHLAERLGERNTKRRFPSFTQEHIASILTSGWLSQGNELGSRIESWFQLEKRSPFFDLRLIEFALALPEEQRWRRDQPKFVLRQAMQGYVPEMIRRRLTKADFSHVFAEALQAVGGKRLFGSLAIAQTGWVDGAHVSEMYRQMAQRYAQSDLGYMSYIWKLWMIFGIELWFSTVFLNKDIFLTKGAHVQATTSQPAELAQRRK